MKFIFVTGGVVSSLGKGITAASLGCLLQKRGLKVSSLKIDPYINVDAGTMSPYQHGEVFVTDDGGETDLDLGNYERFIGNKTTKGSNLTTGKVYQAVIEKERRGDYLGKTVQVIPHVTTEIKTQIRNLAKEDTDIVLVEVGGTVGDIESLPFLEAIRQMRSDLGKQNTLYIHITLVPYIPAAHELKTKPTQHSVKELRSIGISPDIIVCRCEKRIPDELKEKIALFCDVSTDSIIINEDLPSIYQVPLRLKEQLLDDVVLEKLDLEAPSACVDDWKQIVERHLKPSKTVKIALVGKYIALKDAYTSVAESIQHAGIANDAKVEISWVNAEELETLSTEEVYSKLSEFQGILVPGGFGDRGIEGKLKAVRYARENNVPYFGLCLGLQMAVIEFARNVCNLKGANSTEFDSSANYPVVDLIPEQLSIINKGGTMRLGAYPCKLQPHTIAHSAYGEETIMERHRHRYEVNNVYREILSKNGMVFAGTLPDNSLVEIVEIPNHPWFVGVQFHPEFKSQPTKAHPLFREFIKAALTLSK